MTITLLREISNATSYTDPIDPRIYGTRYDVRECVFDTLTLAVTCSTGGYDDFQGNNPPGSDFAVSDEFHSLCIGTTRRAFVGDGLGGFTVADEANSVSCGFTPPAPFTCDIRLAYQLTATPGGADVVLSATAAHGLVQYSLDGGPLQLSPRFFNLAPGRHYATATDAAVAGCQRVVGFVVPVPAPPPAPPGPPVGIDFVGQPLWYSMGAPAGAEVVLELYAESRHGAEDFALVMRLRRTTPAAGRLNFRLDGLLAPLLRAHQPGGAATQVCTGQLVNYFVRTATVPLVGQTVAYVRGQLRTALRGAVAPEAQGRDFFSGYYDGQVQFLTWKPAAASLTPGQPEWLYWFTPPGSPASVRVERVYTVPLDAVPGQANDVIVSETVSLPVGVAIPGAGPPRGPGTRLLAIPVLPRTGDAAVSVAVYDPATGEALSPLLRYAVVPPSERSRYLVFTNSLGGTDTLRTEGRLEAVLEAAADRAERHRLPLDQTPAPERFTFGVAATRKIKLATGWLTRAELAWLQELVLAREIWEWRGGQLLPLELPKRQLTYASDLDALRGLLLEFDYAYAPTAYQPPPDA